MALQDFKLPSWLDCAFLAKVLNQKFDREDVQVHSFSGDAGTVQGDNYASEIFRLSVDSSMGGVPIPLILKKRHASEERHSLVRAYSFFQKEIQFYSDYLPAFYALLRSVDEYEELAPEPFYCDLDEELLVLRDLKGQGYTSGERHTRVSLPAAVVLMRKFAKLHAASMVCNRRRNGALEARPFDMFSLTEGPFMRPIRNNLAALIAECKSWGADFGQIACKLEKIEKEYPELANRAIPSQRGLGVLVHGDSWFTNFLVKRDSATGEVHDALLIDFQMSSWASLATDLLHFIFISLNEDDYQLGYGHLVAEYHGHLERVLGKLRHERIPDLEEIRLEMREKLFHVIYSGLVVKPAVCVDPEEANLETFMADDVNVTRKKYRNPRVQREVQFILKFLDSEGVLDV